MTQEDLAMKSGISRQTIVSIENASTVNVTFKTLVSLADALGVKVDQLFCPK
jgi:transcriptional regulator with XRE-family HTH domain